MTDFVPSIGDIDMKRGCVAVAFLNDTTDDSAAATAADDHAQLAAQFDLEGGDGHADMSRPDTALAALDGSDARTAQWTGVSAGFYEAFRALFVQSYTSARRFGHCELCFFCSDAGRERYGDEYMITCGTRKETGVRVTARRFNRNYTWLYLNVTDAELHCVVKFMFAQHGKRYDARATYKVFTTPRQTDGKRWYCSELVLAALQMLPCAALHRQRPNCVEVDDVYVLMRQSRRLSESSMNITPLQLASQFAGGASDMLEALGFNKTK